MNRFVVFGDKPPSASLLSALSGTFSALPSESSAASRRQISRLAASSIVSDSKDGSTTIFVPSFESLGAQKEAVAVLEEYNVLYLGCRSGPLAYRPQDVIMMAVYSEVPMPRFALVDSTRLKSLEDLKKLRYPVRLSALADTTWTREGEVVEDASQAVTVAQSLFQDSMLVSGFEHQTVSSSSLLTVVVVGFGKDTAFAVIPLQQQPGEGDEERIQQLLQQHAKAIAVNVLNHSGVCTVTFSVSLVKEPLLNLECVALGQGLVEALERRPELATDLTTDAQRHRRKLQKNYVVTFDAETKGYHLRASRNIKKGEIVFEDERRSFVVVTKEFVRRTWSEEDKVVFSRYAWPLDGDGHVYAIWDDEPGRWRPINHSCDPTCIYADPNSLNVIAAHDISEGDDLTLDYASFCDYTMKPFQCHCGTSYCRGMIQPDQVSLEKYGKHSWHRKQPPMEPL